MRPVVRFLRSLRIKWVWLAAAVLAGVFLHIATVLAVTQVTPHRGIQILAGIGQINSMTVLPPVTAAYQPLPFLSPDTRYAVCRFDLHKGPVVIHATLGDDNWTVALYAPSGANVYAVAGADLEQPDAQRCELSLGQGVRRWDCVAQGQHQPIGSGVQHKPHLIGDRAPAGRVHD